MRHKQFARFLVILSLSISVLPLAAVADKATPHGTGQLPVDVASGGEAPAIDVQPLSLSSNQAPNVQTVKTLTINNTSTVQLDWTISEDLYTRGAASWSDNFDSYASGVSLHGMGDWRGWFNDPATTAYTTNGQAVSAPNSLQIDGPADLVHPFTGITSGQWLFSTRVYVPDSVEGASWFGLLNLYDEFAEETNYSTAVTFDTFEDLVYVNNAEQSWPLITDQWVELNVLLDLDADSQTVWYNNQVLSTKSWTEGFTGDGILNIGAVNLWTDPDAPGAAYYDDMSLEAVTACGQSQDISWASVSPNSGSTGPVNMDSVDVAFDSTGLAPGTYTGTLCVSSNDPDPGPGNGTGLVPVEVELVVEEPAIDVQPLSLGSNQLPGVQTVKTLTINNSGTAQLDWTISEDLNAGGVASWSANFDDMSLGPVTACGQVQDISWASVSPNSGSTLPAGTDSVDVTFDSTGLTPGTYTGTLCVSSNDPDPGPGNGTGLVPVEVELVVEEPDIDVQPLSLGSNQLPGVQTVKTLTINNSGTAQLDWTISEDFYTRGAASWSDNFDSYTTGADLHGMGDWRGWMNVPAKTAYTTDAQAVSAPNSLEIVDPADLVHPFTGLTSGQWLFSTKVYLPGSGGGIPVFSLLNLYDEFAEETSYSTAVFFDTFEDLIYVNAAEQTWPLITDQWVELKVLIDLDADSQTVLYNNQVLLTESWTFDSGILNIGAVNLYNFISDVGSAYYDDMSLVPVTACGQSQDISWASVSPNSGSTGPAGMDSVDVTFDSTGLAPGTYTGTLCVSSNDPDPGLGNGTGLVPVEVELVVEAPDIDVQPLSLVSNQVPNIQTVKTLTINNAGTVPLDWTISEDLFTKGLASWSDNFDGYATGASLHGMGDWQGWLNDPAATAYTTDAQAVSAPNSLEIADSADLVHPFTGITSGQWLFSARLYVPGSVDGATRFGLLNLYDGGESYSTIVTFDALNDLVYANAAQQTLPLITDQWVELKVLIDLDADSQTVWYNNQVLLTESWTKSLDGDGILNIGAVNMWRNSPSPGSVYYDDMSLEPATACGQLQDIPWASASPNSGSTVPAGMDSVDVTFDSTGLAPGTYTGTLCVSSNDPDPGPGNGTGLVPVEVEMVVQDFLQCNANPVAFESGIPLAWTAMVNEGPVYWSTTDDLDACGNSGNLTPGTGNAACADSDSTNEGGALYDAELRSNEFDLTGYGSVSLQFALAYSDSNASVDGDFFEIMIWDGSSWTMQAQWDDDFNDTVVLDLSAYSGLPEVRVAFRYSGNDWDRYAQVDDVLLNCNAPGPDIDVQPASLSSNQEPGTQVVKQLFINNLGTETLDWSIFVDAALKGVASWSENFDGYATGADLHGIGGWEGWFDDPGATAFTTAVQALSAPNSVEIADQSDLVQPFTGITTGRWRFSTRLYVPESDSVNSDLILLNQYPEGPGSYNISTYVNFNSATGLVTSSNEAVTLPLITGQWVELKVLIDLDADSQTISYNNQILSAKSWTEGTTGGGILNIGAVNLYNRGGASPVYYDDMSLVPATACSVLLDVGFASGSTEPGETDSIDVTFNSTGLLPGTYVDNLCVTSNDPDPGPGNGTELVIVPVTLTVEADPDIIFMQGFEGVP